MQRQSLIEILYNVSDKIAIKCLRYQDHTLKQTYRVFQIEINNTEPHTR